MKKECRINKVKKMLQKKQQVVGTFCVSHSPAVFETLANCGMDYLIIDTEHFMTNPETIEQLITVMEATGVTPFVRVQENVDLVNRCVSAGARGVIIPMVNTREQAQAAVNAMKYKPLGTRGVCNPRAITYATGGMESLLNFYNTENDNLMCIVMMETEEAYHNLPEILSVKGIDSIFIGRTDLTHNLGITGEFHHPKVEKIIEDTLKMGKEAGLYMGIYTLDGKDSNIFFDMGFDLVAMGGDMMFLSMAARNELAKITR
jgi:2-keto-3-deoxy-L-rhamnonate aldolase RhmA